MGATAQQQADEAGSSNMWWASLLPLRKMLTRHAAVQWRTDAPPATNITILLVSSAKSSLSLTNTAYTSTEIASKSLT